MIKLWDRTAEDIAESLPDAMYTRDQLANGVRAYSDAELMQFITEVAVLKKDGDERKLQELVYHTMNTVAERIAKITNCMDDEARYANMEVKSLLAQMHDMLYGNKGE